MGCPYGIEADDCKIGETDTQIIWHVDQRTWTSRMITDVTCEKKDMLLVNYEDPDGDADGFVAVGVR